MSLVWPIDFLDRVICGDCLEVMKEIPDGAVDAVVTDPPYGVNHGEEWDNWDTFCENISSWRDESMRVSNYRLIWFCADRMIPMVLQYRPEHLHRILIWNKPPGSQYNGASHNNLWYSMEPILVFGDSDNPATSWKGRGVEAPMLFSVFDAATIPSTKFGHPTTKPIRLMRWLINHYSNADHIILDPFAGSGTTLVAAKQLGRPFIGIEINPKYCAIAEDRLRQTELAL